MQSNFTFLETNKADIASLEHNLLNLSYDSPNEQESSH